MPSAATAITFSPDSPAGSGAHRPGTPQIVCSESIPWVFVSARLPCGCTTASSRRSWKCAYCLLPSSAVAVSVMGSILCQIMALNQTRHGHIP